MEGVIDVQYASLTYQGVQHREFIHMVTHPDINPVCLAPLPLVSDVALASFGSYQVHLMAWRAFLHDFTEWGFIGYNLIRREIEIRDRDI